MNTVEVVLQFMERINQHDAGKLTELMTDDHLFVDSIGQSVRGRGQMQIAWQKYFSFCPDYWIAHEEIVPGGKNVTVFGSAGGTITANGQLLPENKWRILAAWRAVAKDGLVHEWHAYADNKPVYDILSKMKSNP